MASPGCQPDKRHHRYEELAATAEKEGPLRLVFGPNPKAPVAWKGIYGDGERKWQHPADDFGPQLAAACEALLTYRADPWKAVEHFEPILEQLKYNPIVCEQWLPSVR